MLGMAAFWYCFVVLACEWSVVGCHGSLDMHPFVGSISFKRICQQLIEIYGRVGAATVNPA